MSKGLGFKEANLRSSGLPSKIFKSFSSKVTKASMPSHLVSTKKTRFMVGEHDKPKLLTQTGLPHPKSIS